eukprot:1376327-Prymnesium_polylepis.1
MDHCTSPMKPVMLWQHPCVQVEHPTWPILIGSEKAASQELQRRRLGAVLPEATGEQGGEYVHLEPALTHTSCPRIEYLIIDAAVKRLQVA